jgi:putative acetyltransferase
MRILQDDLSGPAIAEFIAAHLTEMRSLTPPQSKHALDLDALRHPTITFWSVYDDTTLVACGALKELTTTHAEIKSMRTAPTHHRQGLASALLRHLITEATLRGYTRLSLETGSATFFAPARALYTKHGFQACNPFANYKPDPNSVFMTARWD